MKRILRVGFVGLLVTGLSCEPAAAWSHSSRYGSASGGEGSRSVSGAYILLMLTVLLAARRPRVRPWVGELLRWADAMRPWSMGEVMILGILVALIKIAELATVDPGVGMYAVGTLVVLLTSITVTFDPREVWRRVSHVRR